jgi:pantetheine-phosphate adenylyltransferase
MTLSRKVTAIYPGSFDPVTLGHEDIAHRTLRVADHVIVAVAEASPQSKTPAFSLEERLDMLTEVFSEEPRIECVSFRGLLVEFAKKREADLVVRGLRAVSDFEYEFQMAQMNRELHPDLEFIFLTPDAPLSFLSATIVREVARLGGDVSPFVSPPVFERLKHRFHGPS